MPKPKLHQLDQSGATQGQAPVWDDTAIGGRGAWVPGDVDSASGRALVPLTTVIDGEPSLVWDADNQLVMTEAP